MSTQHYNLIGLMSGTSLDGLDICYARYELHDDTWQFNLIAATTYPYPEELFNALEQASGLKSIELYALDLTLGQFFAHRVNEFIADQQLSHSEIDAIASHGHTVFHQPESGITVQIGCGTTIAYHTGIKVINDFRKKDVVAGGQGAPLVPIGDQLLFSSQAASFLNIGGFANLSYTDASGHTRAFDICPANILINWYMRKLGHSFDKNGRIAGSYPVQEDLLEVLNNVAVYSEKLPHSLSFEWLEREIIPVVENYDYSIETKIATITEHAAYQIGKRLTENAISSVYITGGGSKNVHLTDRIKHHFSGSVILPDERIIDFKEALIFGFLGALNLAGKTNCLSSVTGAERNVIGGTIHLP